METKRKKIWIIWVVLAAVALVAIGAVCALYRGLRPFLRVEAGASLPEIASIAQEGDRYEKEYGTLPVGLHTVRVIHGSVRLPVLVRVRDTVAPTAQARELTIPYGTTTAPDKLVSRIRDAGVVSVTFSEPFDFGRIGDFPVTIVLKDASNNRAEVDSVLHIRACREEVFAEAGAPLPTAEDFLLDGVQATFVGDLREEMMHHIGSYPVSFRLQNGQIAESKLVVSDTTPPTGESAFLWVRPDEPFTPEQLVDRAQDETTLTFAFAKEPDRSLMRAQSVTVRMTDEGGNTADVVSTLAISHVEPITVEISEEPLDAQAFGEALDIVLSEPFVPEVPGIYSISATVNGKPDFALVTAIDTTAPTVQKREDAALYTRHPTSPDAAFAASDLSPVTLEWLQEPDWEKEGEQTVRVRALDRYENETELTETVMLEPDTEPPVLYGVVNRIAYVDEPIAYLAEVYAEDGVDGRTEVAVASEVVPNQEGSYQVVYTSTDASGNTASAACTFKLVKSTVTEEEVRGLAQDVLGSIVTDDMVAAEQLKAVFNYVRGHVHYVGNSDKSDWRKEAARGFKTGKGDCFTFYSVTRALLDELEIDYMSVTRKGGRTRHYWVIVNIGTGWYHFDPTIAPHHKHKCFMWTNKQCQVKPYFWRYEQSSFPEIATDPFDYDAVVKAERSGTLP